MTEKCIPLLIHKLLQFEFLIMTSITIIKDEFSLLTIGKVQFLAYIVFCYIYHKIFRPQLTELCSCKILCKSLHLPQC